MYGNPGVRKPPGDQVAEFVSGNGAKENAEFDIPLQGIVRSVKKCYLTPVLEIHMKAGVATSRPDAMRVRIGERLGCACCRKGGDCVCCLVRREDSGVRLSARRKTVRTPGAGGRSE